MMFRRNREPSDEQIIADLASLDPAKARTAWGYGAVRARESIEVRRALAAFYRQRGVGSQAARWGITTPGWPTTAEIHDLRRWLLGLGRLDDLDEVLALDGAPIPPELSDIALTQLPPPRVFEAPPDRVADASLVSATVTSLVAAVSSGALLFVIAVGPSDAVLWSRVSAAFAVGGLGLAILFWRSYFRRDERRWGGDRGSHVRTSCRHRA